MSETLDPKWIPGQSFQLVTVYKRRWSGKIESFRQIFVKKSQSSRNFNFSLVKMSDKLNKFKQRYKLIKSSDCDDSSETQFVN